MFSDFQCPYCRQQVEILHELLPRYGADLRITFRHLPLPMHPWARQAAEAAQCVVVQDSDAFWVVHDGLYEEQKDITPENVVDTIGRLVGNRVGISLDKYRVCIRERQSRKTIDDDLAFARAHNIMVTPTLFINGKEHRGVVSSDEIVGIIEQRRRLDKKP